MKADSIVDLALGRDLLSVTHGDGTLLHFTRQERAVLLRLMNNPGRLLRRDTLVAAINSEGGEPAGDRHVDFLINQLRKKLRDSARDPRFIKTQYGEGYVWVGDLAPPSDAPPALLRLGPIYGEQLPGAEALMDSITAAIAGRLEPGRMGERNAPGAFTLEASLHDTGRRLQAALVLRDGATSAILATFRVATGGNDDDGAIASTADAIAHAIWSSTALPTPDARMAPSEPPPWVRLFEAAYMMDGDMMTWRSNAERLAAILATEPNNAGMEVMRGLNLYTWLIQSFHDPSGAIVSPAQWQSVEDEIENIALTNLPRVADQPIMQIAVAKLLLFIDRGYLHLSRRLADDQLVSSGAHAAAFAMAGEAAGYAGDMDVCVEQLERAMELSKPGSHFHLYLLIVAATALMAANDHEGFARVAKLTHDVSPDEAYLTMQTYFALPGYETAPLFTHAIAPNAERALEAVRFLWNVQGRRFALRAHRRNVMRPMTAALAKLYGLGVIPDEVDLGTGLRAELSKAGISGT